MKKPTKEYKNHKGLFLVCYYGYNVYYTGHRISHNSSNQTPFRYGYWYLGSNKIYYI